MTPIKPSLHILTIWRIRLFLLILIPTFFSAYFARDTGIVWAIFTGLWFCAFLYLYIFYYPIKWKKLLLSSNDHCLLIHCGVIYTRVKAIPFESILYCATGALPLARFFGVCALTFHMAGARADFPGLTPDQAAEVLRFLSARAKHPTGADDE